MTANMPTRRANQCWAAAFSLLVTMVIGPVIAAGQASTEEPQQGWIASQFQRFRTYPYLDRAYQLIRQDRLEEARTELERYLNLAPADREARINYVLLLYRLKRYGLVIGEASRLLQDKPEPKIYVNRALAREKLQDAAGAIDDYMRAAGASNVELADRSFALRQAADLALRVRKPELALQALDALGPSASPYSYHFSRGMAFDMMARPLAAAEEFAFAAAATKAAAERVRAFEFETEACKRAGNLDGARRALESILEISPNNTSALRSLAGIHYVRKNYRDAITHLRRALASQEAAGDRELLVRALAASELFAEAAKELQPLISARGAGPRLLLLEGELAARQSDPGAARRALTQVLRQEPANPPALRLMAQLAKADDRPGDSLRWMERIPIPQRSTEDIETLAGLYMSQGEPASAVWLYKKLLQTTQGQDLRYGYLVQLGEACKASGRLEEARKAFAQAARLQSGFAATGELAEVLIKSGDLTQAVAQLDRAVDGARSPAQRARAGTLYAMAGSPDKAARQLTLALQGKLPDEIATQARAQRGFAYRSLGKLTEAQADFQTAAGRNPTDGAIWLALGETCLALRDFAPAKQALQRAQALRDDVSVRLLLAQALDGAGEWEPALELYGAVLPSLESGGRSAACLSAMAELETRLGRPAAAAAHALRAYETTRSADWKLLLRALESTVTTEDWAAADALAARVAAAPIPPEVSAHNSELRADIALRLDHPERAAVYLADAIASGNNGWETHQKLGVILYKLGRKQEALESFSVSLRYHGAPLTFMYAGRCAGELGHPHQALEYFQEALAGSPALSTTHICEIHREAGYLFFSGSDYAAAAKAWEQAAVCGAAPLLAVKTAKAWRLADEWTAARKALPPEPPAGAASPVLAEYYDELAAHQKFRGDADAAIGALNKAAATEPAAERHYLLGRWYRESGKTDPAIVHLRTAVELDKANAEYRSALGYALLARKKYAEAVIHFEEALRLRPDSVSLRKDLGYAYIRLSRNEEAIRTFQAAVAAESQVLARSDDEAGPSQRETGRIRQEIERLQNAWDVTTFVAQSSDKRQLPPAPPALGLGVIPSYAGTEVAFTPPGIGLRNERIFQVFGRVLTNLRPGSLRPDPESYTAGMGARYKPLRTQNLFLSGERIFGLRNAAANNWLLRSMYSKDWGYDLRTGQSRWNYSLLYGDLGFYARGPRLVIGYGEYRQGISFNVRDTLVITPHAVADGRFYRPETTADPYVEGGGGVSFKFYLRHGEYDLRRASFEMLLHYRAGRALNPERDTFRGVAASAIVSF